MYTIDDLPFLTQAAMAHSAVQLAGNLGRPVGDMPREIAELQLAEHSTDPATLIILAASRYDAVRGKVAKNPHTPPGTLAELARDDNGVVCNNAAANPSLPVGEVEQIVLLSDHDAARAGALLHPHVPAHVVAWAADSGSAFVRACAARHACLSQRILNRLARDPDPQVRASAAANPVVGRSPAVLRLALDQDQDVRAALARNPVLPGPVVRHLARDPEPRVRAVLAASPHLPEPAAGQLAGDPDPQVRAALAGNPACPAGELARLAAARQPARVRRAAAANPSLPRR